MFWKLWEAIRTWIWKIIPVWGEFKLPLVKILWVSDTDYQIYEALKAKIYYSPRTKHKYHEIVSEMEKNLEIVFEYLFNNTEIDDSKLSPILKLELAYIKKEIDNSIEDIRSKIIEKLKKELDILEENRKYFIDLAEELFTEWELTKEQKDKNIEDIEKEHKETVKELIEYIDSIKELDKYWVLEIAVNEWFDLFGYYSSN